MPLWRAAEIATAANEWKNILCSYFPSVLWHYWLGNRKGIRRVKSWVLVCWWWRFDWSFARLIAPVITTTSITLSSIKIQNGDILVLANPDPVGKWLLKWRDGQCVCVYAWVACYAILDFCFAAEAEAFAANHGCLCLETSAKDAVNISHLFTLISTFFLSVFYWYTVSEVFSDISNAVDLTDVCHFYYSEADLSRY